MKGPSLPIGSTPSLLEMSFLFYMKTKQLQGRGDERAGLEQNRGKTAKLSVLVEQVAAVHWNIKALRVLKGNLLLKRAFGCYMHKVIETYLQSVQ